jgi:AraC family transcriptional regulator of adaptative response / DNA-3-methyladenine glycosylase II
MNLDPATCIRAYQARDARFDGRFVTAVRTTGIFCRPVCRVRAPHPDNVQFFPSAAQALAAGFRPCLRCRPEWAPGHPHWPWQPPLVQAALDALHQDPSLRAQSLAAGLGVSSRHLQRLFQEHLGAAPSAIIHSHRLLLARRLLAASPYPLDTIARASGYGSARRLRQAMVQRYGHPPSVLRSTSKPAQGLSLRLDYRPPLHWQQLLAFWQQRAIPGMEEIHQHSYRRSFLFAGKPGWLEVGPGATSVAALQAQIHHPDSRCLAQVHQRLRHMFDLDAAPAEVCAALRTQAPLTTVFQTSPGLRVPGGWSLFEICVRAILGQRISVAAARTICRRLVQRLSPSHPDLPPELKLVFPEPAQLRDADLAELGIPRARQQTLRSLATLFAEPPSPQWRHAPPAVLTSLAAIHGIGPWTLAYIRMRGLRDPDAWPAGDLILRQRLGPPGSPLSTRECEQRSQAWRPWRAYAVLGLWQTPTGDN